MPSCSATVSQRSGRRAMMLLAVLFVSLIAGTSAGSTVGSPRGGRSSGRSGAAPPRLRDEFDEHEVEDSHEVEDRHEHEVEDRHELRRTKSAEVENPLKSIVMNNYIWAGLSFMIGIAIVRFFQHMEDVEPDVTTGPKAKAKSEDPKCIETCGMSDGQPNADACRGMDGDSEAKVQTLDKKVPVRLRRPPSFHSKLTLIDEANAETISAVATQKRSPAPSRPLPAPGDFQRLFRDTRRAFAEALEDLEKEEWENRLQSSAGTGLFRESQKAFASALEVIEAEERLRSPSFVSVN